MTDRLEKLGIDPNLPPEEILRLLEEGKKKVEAKITWAGREAKKPEPETEKPLEKPQTLPPR